MKRFLLLVRCDLFGSSKVGLAIAFISTVLIYFAAPSPVLGLVSSVVISSFIFFNTNIHVGGLRQVYLHGANPKVIVVAKVVSHWCKTVSVAFLISLFVLNYHDFIYLVVITVLISAFSIMFEFIGLKAIYLCGIVMFGILNILSVSYSLTSMSPAYYKITIGVVLLLSLVFINVASYALKKKIMID